MEDSKYTDNGFMIPIENDRLANIVRFELGSEGLEFVKSELVGTGSLSLLVQEFFGLQGECFAPLEDIITPKEAREFKYSKGSSKFDSGPTVAIRKWLASYIDANWGHGCQLFFADPWYKPEDYDRKPPACKYFFANSIPYLALQENSTYESLTKGSLQVESFNYPAFVISPPVLLPLDGQEVSNNYMQEVARNTKAVLVSAYDHEGYVVWKK